jgi:hypothetical protein
MKKKDFGEFTRELLKKCGEATSLDVLDKACSIFLEKGKCSEEELIGKLEMEEREDLKKSLAFLRENFLVKVSPESIAPTPIGIMINSNIQNLQKVYEEHCNPPPRLRQPIAGGEIPLGARDFIITLDGLIDDGQGFIDKQNQLEKTIKTLLSYSSESGREDYELIEKDAEEVMMSFTDIGKYLDQITKKYAEISRRVCK